MENKQTVIEIKANIYDLLVQAEVYQQKIQSIQDQISLLNQKIKDYNHVIPN